MAPRIRIGSSEIQSRAEHFDSDKNLFCLPRIKPRFLGCETLSKVSKVTGEMRLLCIEEYFQYVAYQRYTTSAMQIQGHRDRVRVLVKKKSFRVPSKGEAVKYLFTKSERLTLTYRGTWACMKELVCDK